ncbi:MAG: hypothetical protein WCA16_13000 [Candidatus Sulfotelmatobacter sp.]
MTSFLTCIARSVTIALLLSLLSMAQQPETPAPAPSGQETPKKPDGPKTSGDTKSSEPQGKSKLERETGTVNDRILEVMPNYGTVENADRLPPISTGQKYRLATAGVLDYFTFPFIGGLAAIDQANTAPKSWGQGWGAYGKRYGASFADNGIGTYMTTAILPSAHHEDPRYYQLGKGSIPHRTFYSLGRLFVARTDSGHSRFNYSELLGNAAAAGLSNFYHAPEDRTLGRNLGTYGMLDMWDGVSNLMKEFWPDIRRTVFKKHNPGAAPEPANPAQ